VISDPQFHLFAASYNWEAGNKEQEMKWEAMGIALGGVSELSRIVKNADGSAEDNIPTIFHFVKNVTFDGPRPVTHGVSTDESDLRFTYHNLTSARRAVDVKLEQFADERSSVASLSSVAEESSSNISLDMLAMVAEKTRKNVKSATTEEGNSRPVINVMYMNHPWAENDGDVEDFVDAVSDPNVTTYILTPSKREEPKLYRACKWLASSLRYENARVWAGSKDEFLELAPKVCSRDPIGCDALSTVTSTATSRTTSTARR